MEDEQLLRLRYKPADLLRWEAALRRLGPDLVRLRFDEGARPGAREDQVVRGLVPEEPSPPADFVERWLRGQATKVVSVRAMLPAIGAAAVLVVLSFFAWWTLSEVLRNPLMAPGTLPTIASVESGRPAISQVYPAPGTPSPVAGTSPPGPAAAGPLGAGSVPVAPPGAGNPAAQSVTTGTTSN